MQSILLKLNTNESKTFELTIVTTISQIRCGDLEGFSGKIHFTNHLSMILTTISRIACIFGNTYFVNKKHCFTSEWNQPRSGRKKRTFGIILMIENRYFLVIKYWYFGYLWQAGIYDRDSFGRLETGIPKPNTNINTSPLIV